MTRKKILKRKCYCSLLGPDVEWHEIKETPKVVERHEKQYMEDRAKLELVRDLLVQGQAEKKSRETIAAENTIPLHMRAHPEDSFPTTKSNSKYKRPSVRGAVDEYDIAISKARDDDTDHDEIPRIEVVRTRDVESKYDRANHSESEVSNKPYETGDETESEPEIPTGTNGEPYEDTIKVGYEGFLDMLEQAMKELEKETADDDFDPSLFDYTNPIYETSVNDLETIILNDIRRAGGGVARQQFRRLRTFIDMCTENGKPKDERAAAKLLAVATFFKGKNYDCCKNSCMSYYNYPKFKNCQICGQNRYHKDGRPVAQYTVFPLEHRLRLQFSNIERAKLLREYREGAEQTVEKEGIITDYWNGLLHKKLLREKKLFPGGNDLALQLSTDGTKAYRIRFDYNIWPVAFQLMNLPPEMRVIRSNLLLSMVIPGPENPKSIDTFLAPVVRELVRLEAGIPKVWDASRKKFFTMRAMCPIVAADWPARATLLHTNGPKSLSFCDYCDMKAYKAGGCYSPHTAPTKNVSPFTRRRLIERRLNGEAVYDILAGDKFRFRNPPRQTDKSFRAIAKEVEKAAKTESIVELKKKHGISGVCVFSRLRAIVFPWSFPPCGMHLYLEGICGHLLRHLRGVYFKSDTPDEDVILGDVDDEKTKKPKKSQPVEKAARKKRKKGATNVTEHEGGHVEEKKPEGKRKRRLSHVQMSEEEEYPIIERVQTRRKTKKTEKACGNGLSSQNVPTTPTVDMDTKSGMQTDDTGYGNNDPPKKKKRTRKGNPDKKKKTDRQDASPIRSEEIDPALDAILLEQYGIDLKARRNLRGGGGSDEENTKNKRARRVTTTSTASATNITGSCIVLKGLDYNEDDYQESPFLKYILKSKQRENRKLRKLAAGIVDVHSDMGDVDGACRDDVMEGVVFGSDGESEYDSDTECSDPGIVSTQQKDRKLPQPGGKKGPIKSKKCNDQEMNMRIVPEKRARGRPRKDTIPGAKDAAQTKKSGNVDKSDSAKDKLPKFRETDDPYNIKPEQWNNISDDVIKSNATFPAEFGDNMKKFTTNCHRLKAANMQRWTLSESLVHFYGRLPEFHYTEYLNFVMIVRMSMKYQISMAELEDLYYRILRFSDYYEKYMFRYDYGRSGACRPSFHQLRHVAEAIRWCGPMFVYWQFPMERLCGMIKFQIKSRVKTNTNIANVQRMIEQTNLLPFVISDVDGSKQTAWACYDNDGNFLLEKLLARTLRRKKKANRFLERANARGDWDWDDVFSDSADDELHTDASAASVSSDDDGIGIRPGIDRRVEREVKRISKYRRLVDMVPMRTVKRGRRVTQYQQTLIRKHLSDWYEGHEHEIDQETVPSLLQAGSDAWSEIMASTTLWRSMDLRLVTKVGKDRFIVRSKRMRLSGTEYRRKSSTRSAAMCELKPPGIDIESGTDISSSKPRSTTGSRGDGCLDEENDNLPAYPGRFAETFLFFSIPIPIRRSDSHTGENGTSGEHTGPTMVLNGVEYECFDYHVAVVRYVPVRRRGPLLEARIAVKGRQLEVVACEDIRWLVGLIHSRDKKYIVWEHGCFDYSIVPELDRRTRPGWKDEIKTELDKRVVDDADPYGGTVDVADIPDKMVEDDMEDEEVVDGPMIEGVVVDAYCSDEPSDADTVLDFENKDEEESEDCWELDTELSEADDMKLLSWTNSNTPANREHQVLRKFAGLYERVNMKADGNCGFRVISSFLLGDAGKFQTVRDEVADYFASNQQRYMADVYGGIRPTSTMSSESLLRDIRGSSTGRNNWFVSPWHAQLVADRYGVFVATVSNARSMRIVLFAPNRDEWDENTVLAELAGVKTGVIGMLFVDGNHWDYLMFKWESPQFREKLMKAMADGYISVRWKARPHSALL